MSSGTRDSKVIAGMSKSVGVSIPSDEILKDTESDTVSVLGIIKKDSSIWINPLSKSVVSTSIINVWEEESILI